MLKILGRMPEQEYRKMPELTQSELCLMAESPRHFELKVKRETEAMNFGTLFHMAILEPTHFKESYIVEPRAKPDGTELNKRSSKDRDWLEAWKLDHIDRVVISEKDMELLTKMLNECARNPKIQGYFQGGISECVATWTYRDLACKGRADYFISDGPEGRVLTELKTTRSAKHENFCREMYNYNYDIQAFWYTNGFEANKHIIVAVDKHEPHGVGIFNTVQYQEVGRVRCNKLIDQYLRCKEINHWPSYTDGEQIIYPPSWVPGILEEEEINETL